MTIKISDRKIGKGYPCFIIAEAGVNHNGDVKLAEKLIDAAKKAGADAVKFQTFKAENLVIEKAEMADYQIKNTKKKQGQLAMLKKLELGFEEFIRLKKYCDKKGIIFLSTPHSEDAVDFLYPFVPAYKIGSGDLTNIPLLEKIAKKQKPLIISTGMSTLKEIRRAVSAVKRAGNPNIVLMHCTTNYPCPLEEVNLKAMKTLEKEFNVLVGYSDHTEGIIVSGMAIALGAKIIEKHFTLSKDLAGPDHKASLEPDELKDLVITIREIEKALGSSTKKPAKSEFSIKKIVRKSLIAKTNIDKGAIISRDMITCKRPGTGIPPFMINKVIGKKAKTGIEKDQLLLFKDLI